ncbi:hypothetical protein RJ44_19975 [Alteromonas macleodii]|uniref:hypothetical protein n=1 Tax=Alteromonas macleodii TaxID=28108 RepID=UPI00057D79A1|nr:hypothetical protein [Alteromonas macleodii]KHT53278.1 hypothetical protein RJ44_19975 [Alteromonas macleodii]
MISSYSNDVRAIVADTYLAYTSDIGGAEAFKRFVSRVKPLVDVRRDPRFSAFTDEELIDEMLLLEHDITRTILKLYSR